MRQGQKTSVDIRVIADDHEQLISLPNTLYDSKVAISLIPKIKASATQGRTRIATPVSVIDSSGQCHSSSSTISLRWRYADGSQSFQETFYIVDSCGSYDAILRGGSETSPSLNAIPQAHPVSFHIKDKDRRSDTKEQAKQKQEQYKREVAEQQRMVRDNLNGMKQNVKQKR